MARGALRALVVVLLLAVATTAAVLLVGGRESYEVVARFQTASQLVKGNTVQIGGRTVGEVVDIDVSPDWQADVRLRLDDEVVPLRRGTRAVIRQASLTGVANRFIDLHLPPGDVQEPIRDGGLIPATQTRASVDLDQLFNTLGPQERKGLQDVVQGLGEANAGRSQELDAGLRYLPAALGEQRRLLAEIGRDRRGLQDFVIDTAALTRDVAAKRDDLAGLVTEVADFTGALASRREELGETLERLPPFMRRANTTFVDLRAALDDLDPLLQETRPVARRLGPLLAELRPFAAEARPTLRDLAATVRRPGPANDLVELTRSNVPLRDQFVSTARRNGEDRPGTLPQGARALRDSREPLAFLRPYSPDLLGWFDDFSHSGQYDALGGFARIGVHVNAFALAQTATPTFIPVPPQLRDELFDRTATTDQRNRCPGSAERPSAEAGNAGKPTPDFNCDPSQVPPGR